MVDDLFDEEAEYVCISHMTMAPCHEGEHHLVSNWPGDVARVLDKISNIQ